MELYRDHLIQRRILDEGEPYELYQPIFLKSYFFRDPSVPRTYGLLNPKQRHGAPMAALRRGFTALASPRFCQLKTPIMDQLKI